MVFSEHSGQGAGRKCPGERRVRRTASGAGPGCRGDLSYSNTIPAGGLQRTPENGSLKAL